MSGCSSAAARDRAQEQDNDFLGIYSQSTTTFHFIALLYVWLAGWLAGRNGTPAYLMNSSQRKRIPDKMPRRIASTESRPSSM